MINASFMLSPTTPGGLHFDSSPFTESSVGTPQPIDFSTLISDQLNAEGLMKRLQEQLSPEQFEQLIQQLTGGKGLPEAANFAALPGLQTGGLFQEQASIEEWIATIEAMPQLELEQLAQALSELTPEESAALPGWLPALVEQLTEKGGGSKGLAVDRDGRGSSSTAVMINHQPGTDGKPLMARGMVAPQSEVQVDQVAKSLLNPGVALDSTKGQSSAPVIAQLLNNVNAAKESNQSKPAAIQSHFATLMAGQDAALVRSEPASPPTIQTPVGEKGWETVLSNRIKWLVGKEMQGASVKVTPRHLGPIDIQVSVKNDQTNVNFVTHNTVVKEAIEAAIPRLREMFSDSNMELVNVDVQQQEKRQSQAGGAGVAGNDSGGSKGESGAGDHDGSTELAEEGAEQRRVVLGLVDDYA